MIIHIDIEPLRLDGDIPNDIYEFINEIVRIYRLATHIIVMKRPLCRKLIDLQLDEYCRAALMRIGNNYTQYAQLVESSEIHLKVTHPDDFHIPQENVIICSYKTFLNLNMSDGAKLLLENGRNDAGIYIEMISSERALRSIPSFKIDVVHGGGDDIVGVARAEIEKSALFLVVVDSDRSSPQEGESLKKRSITAEFRRANYLFGRCLETPGHEAENFLSVDELSLLPQWQGYSSSADLIAIDMGRMVENCEFMTFLDLKLGLQVQGLDLNDMKAAWLYDKMQHYGVERIAGMGNRVPQSFANEPRAIKNFHKTMRKPAWRDIFGSCAAHLLWWFAADSRHRAI